MLINMDRGASLHICAKCQIQSTKPEYRLAEIAGPVDKDAVHATEMSVPVDKDRVHASRDGRCSRRGPSTR